MRFLFANQHLLTRSYEPQIHVAARRLRRNTPCAGDHRSPQRRFAGYANLAWSVGDRSGYEPRVETSVPVTVGGKYAAVRFASLTQFSIQIPFDAPAGATTIQVGNSAAFSITLSQFAPALYTANQTGSGNASALHSDGRPITVLRDRQQISISTCGQEAIVPIAMELVSLEL